MTSIDSSPEDLAHLLPLSPSGSWANDLTFGIIHPSGCDICRSYVSHNIEAYDEHDYSFELAIKDRDSKFTTRFLDGFREGRRMQKNHDSDRLSLLQAQRDDANMLNARNVEDIRILREKLAEAQDSLQAMQVAFDEVSMHVDVSRPTEEAPDDTALMDMQKALLASSEDQAARLSSKFLNEILFATENSISKDFSNQRISPIDEAFPTIPFASPSRQFEGHSTWDDELSDSSSSESALSYTSASASPSSSSSSTESLQPSPIATIDSLEALKSLMAAAHESGNSAQLKKVKSLCSVAHHTARGQRTVLQNYLINNWRNPPGSYFPSRHADNAPIFPPVPQVPEIYVDACPGGIGFVMGDKWLAWRLIEGWQTDTRDNNWGEMVAVELGLRAIISAGYQRTALVIRSDNFGVVQSLTTGISKARQQNLILKKILNLSRVFEIRLEPRWVSTKDNLADNPSRGRFAAASLMFQTPPTLPEHLLEFIQPVLLENMA